jgi:hypothetical protein
MKKKDKDNEANARKFQHLEIINGKYVINILQIINVNRF